MSEADILRTIEDYATTAALAREAGYDGVEIMGSEGYLINEFTAPRTNDRGDDWGGSLENRLRLGVEIMAVALFVIFLALPVQAMAMAAR